MKTPDEINMNAENAFVLREAAKAHSDGYYEHLSHGGKGDPAEERWIEALNAGADSLAYIQQLESTASQVKTLWVSVKEELPETTDVYLVNAVHRYNKKDGYRSVQIRLFLKDHENEWVGLPDLYEITHWMPLPELLKEGD